MHPLIQKVETLEAEIEKLNQVATIGVVPKIKKLEEKLETIMNKIAVTPKAIESWEERYAETFSWGE